MFHYLTAVYFCLFLRSVSVVESCAPQERLKEAAKNPLPYLLIKFIDSEMKFWWRIFNREMKVYVMGCYSYIDV